MLNNLKKIRNRNTYIADIHFQFNGADVDEHKTHQWLKNKRLKADEYLFNRNFLVNIKMGRYNI